MIYYSLQKQGFYDDSMNANIPEDAVEMTLEEHAALFDGAANGNIIVWGENGPYLEPIPGPTPQDLITMKLAKRDSLLAEAAIRIAPLQDAVDLDEATAAEVALLKKWKQYRIALNRIEQQPGFPDVDWPSKPS